MKNKFLISVDLGGTKVLCALINNKGEIISRKKISTLIDKGPAFIVKSIAGSIKALLTENDLSSNDLKAISLGVPGTVNIETGKIGNAPNIGMKNYNIKESLKKIIDVPIYVDNDVNLAAMGIKKYEFGDKVNNMLVMAVGTGIGSAFILNGAIYRGSSYYAGEIGFMIVDVTDSNSEVFEKVASRTAVVAGIVKNIKRGKKSMLKEHINSGKKIKSKMLAEAIQGNDELVIKHLGKSCEVIGNVCANIVSLLNIDTIVFAGGVIEAMDKFMLPKIKSSFKKAVLKEPGKKVKIVATKLGDDAALLGGIALAEEFEN